MNKPRVMLADDHTLVAETFARLLSDNYEVVCVVSDGVSLLEQAPALRPDVVILDLGLPLLDGMNAGGELKRLLPSAKIVVLTMSEDVDVAREVLKHWASAYVLKCEGPELVKAIRQVLNHETYVSPRIERQLAEDFARNA